MLTSFRPRRRGVPVLAAASILVVFAGCGGNGNRPNDPAGVARQFVSDVSNKKWKAACNTFSKAAKAQVAILQSTIQAPDCATTLGTVGEQPGNAIAKIKPADVQVTHLKVTGDHATLDLKPSLDKDPKTYLVKEGGQWKLDADPAPAATTVGGDSGETGPTGKQGTTTSGSG